MENSLQVKRVDDVLADKASTFRDLVEAIANANDPHWDWTHRFWFTGELNYQTDTGRGGRAFNHNDGIPPNISAIGCCGHFKGQLLRLSFDLDVGHGHQSYDTLDDAIKDAQRIREALGEAEVRLSKSGKGVHVHHLLPIDNKLEPKDAPKIQKYIAKKLGLKCDATVLGRSNMWLWARNPGPRGFDQIAEQYKPVMDVPDVVLEALGAGAAETVFTGTALPFDPGASDDGMEPLAVKSWDKPDLSGAMPLGERMVASMRHFMHDWGMSPERSIALLEAAGAHPAPLSQWVRMSRYWSPARGWRRSELMKTLPAAKCAPQPPGGALPGVVSLLDMVDDETLVPKPDLIEGIVRLEHMLIVNAPSKARKTWMLQNLALAAANGGQFLGRQVRQCRALYLNFELDPADFKFRAIDIAGAMKCSVEGVDCLHMRDHAASIDKLVGPLVERAGGHYGVIIFDPLYSCLGDREENAAGDMNDMLMHMRAIAKRSGATIVIAHHFAKGLAANKNSIDRGSGSGVLSRFPDAVMTVSELDTEDCMGVSLHLRAHKPIKDFGIRWDYPLFRTDGSLNPKDLKTAISTGKGQPRPEDVVEVMGEGEFVQKRIIERLTEGDFGFAVNSSREAFRKALHNGQIHESGREHTGGRPQVLFKVGPPPQR